MVFTVSRAHFLDLQCEADAHDRSSGAQAPQKRSPRTGRELLLQSADVNGVAARQFLFRMLGQSQHQNAVFILGGDILGLHIAHVEATAARAGIALLADILALLVLRVLVQTLGSADRQVAVLQIHVDLILMETGQVDVQLVVVVRLPHIGLHEALGVLAVQGVMVVPHREETKVIIKEIIKQVLTKNAR